ncbi:sensor histidine kinase [Nocardioides sp. MAHUQ-72]|uniref:sensor histidine kinase n=1 Tax=unclassified Nocardioides TaxID=2615069 RepID=UPI0036235946
MRVFALALATGQALNAHTMGASGVFLIGLAIVGTACCGAELNSARGRTLWVSIAEGVMTALLIGVAGDAAEPVLVYLAIPAVVAGINHGRLATVNTSLAGVLTLAAAWTEGQPRDELVAGVAGALPWLVIGLGAGLLAATQTSSLRRLEEAQAPYAAAHRLVGQLHTLVGDLPMTLDVEAHARSMQDSARSIACADRSAILVSTRTGRLEPVASPEPLPEGTEEAARLCHLDGHAVHRSGVVAFPLRVGQHVFGALVLERWTPLAPSQSDAVQAQLDEHAIRLETALLIDDVRAVATTEERNRLAREIHDGVAQRIVALGYLADDVAALSADPLARSGVQNLRAEITGLIDELRFSVFDLRHDIGDASSLSAALSEYVRELSTHSGLRVHLTLDERGEQLSSRTASEVLRIAKEALGNVQKHARAINVWVSLTVNDTGVRLVVEDDGIGGATPRVGHFGLHTMCERATRIDAELQVGTRRDGGTVVTLRSRPSGTTTRGAQHDQRLARR